MPCRVSGGSTPLQLEGVVKEILGALCNGLWPCPWAGSILLFWQHTLLGRLTCLTCTRVVVIIGSYGAWVTLNVLHRNLVLHTRADGYLTCLRHAWLLSDQQAQRQSADADDCSTL